MAIAVHKALNHPHDPTVVRKWSGSCNVNALCKIKQKWREPSLSFFEFGKILEGFMRQRARCHPLGLRDAVGSFPLPERPEAGERIEL